MRRAFSLIELLIVVVIIGVVYSLSVSSFSKVNDAVFKLNLGNLKEYLQSIEHQKSVKILCLDECSSCEIYVDGTKYEEASGKLDNFLDESVRVYTYDFSYGTQLKQKDIYFNEEDVEEEVCFSYEVDAKGVGEQVYVKFQESVYDFSTYFTPTPKYTSLDEALDAKEELVSQVR